MTTICYLSHCLPLNLWTAVSHTCPDAQVSASSSVWRNIIRDRVPDHVPAVPPRLAHFRYRLRHKSLLHYYSICTCTVDVYWHAFRGYAAYHSSTLNGWWEGLAIHILKLFYHLHWSLLAMLISIYYCATFSLNVCLCYLCTQSVSYNTIYSFVCQVLSQHCKWLY